MSLLLDALKKAADEKKKNGSSLDEQVDSLAIEEDLISPVDTESTENLDLDLEIQETEEEFPEVEDALDISDQNIEIDSAPEQDYSADTEGVNSKVPEVDSLNVAENTSEVPDPVDEMKSDSDAGSEENIHIDGYPPGDVKVDSAVEISDSSLGNQRPAPGSTKNDIKNIEHEKALEALIKKSNQSTRSNKLKTNISIVLIVLLLLVFAVGYYFVEVTTSTQQLFIADKQDINAIDRPTQKPMPAVNKASITSSSPIVNKVAPVSASVNNQQTKQSVRTITKTAVKKPAKKINIVRKTVADPIDVLLRRAYAAFNAEEFTKSNDLYTQVIHRDANNRDALLGLAAIGIKSERYEYSRQKYLQLLNLNPKDSYARAGLSTIEGKIDPQLNESQLKFMLREQPEAAHLYFALGSLYASQEKWPEAQTAYFSAWSAENKNADYTYSLAVSLDHLGKKQQAKDFYELSIKLKQASGGNFSVDDTKNRISFLKDSDS